MTTTAAQFRYINQQVRRFQAAAQSVISVDTKKKELVGDFKNAGRQWRPKGRPALVRVHDFLIPERGKAIPYGVYDLTRNAGWVSVGIDHDTARFATRTISRRRGLRGRSVAQHRSTRLSMRRATPKGHQDQRGFPHWMADPRGERPACTTPPLPLWQGSPIGWRAATA